MFPRAARKQAEQVARPGAGPASSTVVDVGAIAAELRRKSEGERAAAGEDDLALPGRTRCVLTSVCAPPAVMHAGKRPAREGDGTVVGAGRDNDPAGA